MEAPFAVAADHALAVVVATVVWQRTDIPPACIELRPAHVAELLDAVDIGQQSGRLLPVGIGVLALVPRNGRELRVPEYLPDLSKLPDACWFASMRHAQVLWVL